VKKPTKESVPTSIRLPREEYDWLRDMPGGVPAGIKRGLELIAIEEKADEPTRQFVSLILKLAREVELETGSSWHVDAGAYRTFRRAIMVAGAKWHPTGVPDATIKRVQLKPFQERPHASHPTDEADDLGVWLAHDVVDTPDDENRARVRAAREKSLRKIVWLHQNREGAGNEEI
jgi:hypothetical protein